MKSYKGTFIKKDGSQRTMSFLKVADLPHTMLEGMVKGTGKVRTLPDGSEMVYDLESKEFRIFNHKTLVGEILETDLDESVLSEQNRNMAVEEICSTVLNKQLRRQ